MSEFKAFSKIPRLNREVVVTEKLDGTNACVVISDDLATVNAQSRTRIITPEADNFGFAGWVKRNADELRKLGPGFHFGEWWGVGIQRGYGLTERRFSLFNASRWADERPACCHVVPVLVRGIGFDCVYQALAGLQLHGSCAAPGFMKPEGIVAFHTQGNLMFKVTLEKDDERKGQS